MSPHNRFLLLCTNGDPAGLVALEYGAWLAERLKLSVKLLGIVERPSRHTAVLEALRQAEERLAKAAIPYGRHLQEGRVRDLVCAMATSEEHLTVIGGLGRPLWQRWLHGSSFRHIAAEIQTPLIYVPEMRERLDSILVCTGGLEYAHSAEQWALYLARRAPASITLLHITGAVYYDYPTARQVNKHWKNILETDTPQGQHLRQALQEAQAAGVEAKVQVRRGDVVREILAEVREGKYDLVAMGSSRSSKSLRHLYLPDVTAEIAQVIAIPILTALAGQDCNFE